MRKLALLLAAIVLASLPVATSDASPVNKRCAMLPAATPFGTTACPGVRPGAFVEAPQGGCTLGYVYADKYKQLYMTTGGHCAVAEGQYKLWAPGKGPIARVGGKAIGRFVYARYDADPYVYDIGLIRITKGVKVSAQVCHFGGPTGSSSSVGDVLEIYGNATGLSFVLPARTLAYTTTPNRYEIYAAGPAFLGDSGGPILDSSNGRAIGFLVAFGYDARTSPAAGIVIKKLGPQMYAVSKALHKTFYLKTAKRL